MTVRAFLLAICFPVVCYPLARPQGYDYRLELSNGTTGQVIFTNLSEKTVEAFHAEILCGNGTQRFDHDIFLNFNVLQTGQGRHKQGIEVGHGDALVQPQERIDTWHQLPPQQSPCAPVVKATAVIFSDGSVEGDGPDRQDLQALIAQREGVVAGVQFWLKRVPKESNASNIDTMLPEAEALTKQDFRAMFFPGCRIHPALCAYWKGRWTVDLAMANRLAQNNNAGFRDYAGAYMELEQWQTKIATNTALPVLRALYPETEQLVDTTVNRERENPLPTKAKP